MKYVLYAAMSLDIILCLFLKQYGEAFATCISLLFCFMYYDMVRQIDEIKKTVTKVLSDAINRNINA